MLFDRAMKDVLERFQSIGIKPLCNMRADRAPHIGKYYFVLCWRCSSISIGMLLSYSYITVLSPNIAIYLIIPTVADSILQYYVNIESSNIRRLVSGLFAGIGIGYLVKLLTHYIIGVMTWIIMTVALQ